MDQRRNEAIEYARGNKEKFLDDLKTILSIPSISTGHEHKSDIQKTAEWLAAKLIELKMNRVQIIPTEQHPIVYGEWLEVKNAPVILIYGHYDVQPVDPINLWKTDPFTPTIIADDIFARGASDMKGQAIVVIKAVESYVRTNGLPINIKWILEGEEEIGSPSLEKFLQENKELLACNIAVNPDSGMMGKEYPTITNALRGIAYFELTIYGPKHDLHSGIYGGVVHNPAIVLADIINGLHDENGRVTLPGFYDSVRKLTQKERDEMARLPIGDKHFLEQTGVPALYGEKGYTANERTGARPTLDVNGILSGFVEEGSKTVIPSSAMAKISMRLVPNQNPVDVKQQLLAYLEKRMPGDVTWDIKEYQSGMPSISDMNNFGIRAMAKAMESVWNIRPYFHREGGSIPVVAQMQTILGIESVIAGFGLPDDNVHAPNEKQNLTNWYRGIETYINFFANLAEHNNK